MSPLDQPIDGHNTTHEDDKSVILRRVLVRIYVSFDAALVRYCCKLGISRERGGNASSKGGNFNARLRDPRQPTI